jgi:hypothetical protein
MHQLTFLVDVAGRKFVNTTHDSHDVRAKNSTVIITWRVSERQFMHWLR